MKYILVRGDCYLATKQEEGRTRTVVEKIPTSAPAIIQDSVLPNAVTFTSYEKAYDFLHDNGFNSSWKIQHLYD